MSSPGDFLCAAAGLQVGAVPRRPKKNPSQTARWLRSVRGELTQEKFAAALDVDRTTVADWERGANSPEWPSVQKILAKFPNAAPFPGSAEQPDGSTGMSDPRSTVPSSNNEHVEGYTVKTDEARIVAKMLDALPEELRPLAMTEMITAWRKSDVNPSAPSVDRRPGHARKTS